MSHSVWMCLMVEMMRMNSTWLEARVSLTLAYVLSSDSKHCSIEFGMRVVNHDNLLVPWLEGVSRHMVLWISKRIRD